RAHSREEFLDALPTLLISEPQHDTGHRGSARQPTLRSRRTSTRPTLKMGLASSIIEEAPQLPRPARVLQLPKSLGLDLADSFTRNRKLIPNLLQGVVVVHTDAEAHAEDAFFAWRQ